MAAKLRWGLAADQVEADALKVYPDRAAVPRTVSVRLATGRAGVHESALRERRGTVKRYAPTGVSGLC